MSYNVYIDGHIEEVNPKKRKATEEAVVAKVRELVAGLPGVHVAHGSFATLGYIDIPTGEAATPPGDEPAAEQEPAPEA